MYSIILPCYNEIDNLKLLIVEIKNILKNFDFEIIIIDDNSKDGTEQMIIENFSKMQNLKFIKRENKKRSLGKSVLEGILEAKNNYVIVMDSDFNHDPNDLLKIIEIQMKHHYDLICCSRFIDKKSRNFILRYKLSEYYNLLLKPLINSKINNKKVIAYGAAAKGNTLLNYCGICSEHISVVIDKNPLKHGLMTAGSDIPIVSYEDGLSCIEDSHIILLLAWNFKDEIIQDLRQSGYKGGFIVPLPGHPYIAWDL